MKTKYYLPFVIVLLNISVLAGQSTTTQTETLYPAIQSTIEKNTDTDTHDGSSTFRIGRDEEFVYRTYAIFNLYKITDNYNVEIDEVKVHYQVESGESTFKLTSPSSIDGNESLSAIWDAIGGSDTEHGGIDYEDGSVISTGIKDYMQAELSTDRLVIGMLSESESDSSSVASVTHPTLTLEVTFTSESYQITVRNDFDIFGQYGGQVGVGKNASPTSKSSPHDLMVNDTDQINLEAYDNQNLYGYKWAFNDTEAPENESRWRIDDGQSINNLSNPNSQSNSYNPSNDPDATIFNEQKPYFKVKREDLTELGSATTGVLEEILEDNSKQITAPSSKTVSGEIVDFAGWQDNPSAPRQRSVSPDDHTTYAALYKGKQISNDASAYTNNSQRRLVQTEVDGNVWLHQVYTSMGHVWIEHSDDGGATWTIGNDGKPLDGGAGGKNPSIAYTHDSAYTNGSWLYLNYIGVVWQQPYSSTYKIMGKMFTQFSTGSQLPGDGTWPSTLHTEPSDSYSVDANPGLALAEFAFHPYLVTFERKSTSGSWSPGINWLVGQVEDQGSYTAGPFGDVEGEGVISGTNASSLHAQPSLASSQQYEMGVNVIRQQGTGSSGGKIYAHFLLLTDIGSLNNTGNIDWDVYQYNHNNGNPISYPGYSWSPSLVTLGNDNSNFSACWIEYTDMVYYYLGNPTSRYYYGYYDAESCSINRGSGSNGNDGYAVWSQTLTGSSWDNMSILFDEGIPQSSHIRTLSTSGKYIQLGNNVTGGTANMYASALKPTGSSPYTFQTSSSMGPALKQVKQGVVEHRGFILNVGETAFRYRFGGLKVDGQHIGFTEAPDTAYFGNLETLNSVLLTEPFQVKAHSEIVFTEQPGFADSAAAARALGKDDYLRYTVELIDEATGRKAGTLREENVTASQPRSERSRAFAVNPAGLAGKTVRAKITLETNLVELKEAVPLPENFPAEIREAREGLRHSNLVLTKHYRKAGDGEAMDKSGLEELSTMEESPESFSLGQNYPNPFNPSTVISYQLPENSMVHLVVYDLLGRKVATLVHERQSTGKYSVNFDASHLASGVYLYRLQAGEFTESRKLFLVK